MNLFKHVTVSDAGLLANSVWLPVLRSYPLDLFLKVREKLQSEVCGLGEKFNENSRYFGYRKNDGADVLYIYIQQKRLRIDLRIDRRNEDALRRAGFAVKYINNFQGRAGWLTGWHVPHDAKNVAFLHKMIKQAFASSS